MLYNSTNKFLFNLVKDRPIYVFTCLSLSLVSTLFNILGTIFLIVGLGLFWQTTKDLIFRWQPVGIRYFLSWLQSFEDGQKILVIVISTSLLFVIQNILDYLIKIINIQYFKNLSCKLQIKSIALLYKIDFNAARQNKIGDIFLKLNRELERTIFTIQTAQQLVITLITILFITIWLNLISWRLSLISLMLIGSLFWINYLLANYVKKYKSKLPLKVQLSNRQLKDLIASIPISKILGNEDQEYHNIIRLIKDNNQTQIQAQSAVVIIKPGLEISNIIVISLLLSTGYYLYVQQSLEFIPILLTYTVILFKLLPLINQSTDLYTQFNHNYQSAEIISSFINTATKQPIKSGSINFDKLSSGIEFKSVTFAYDRSAKIVLDNINLWIPQGTTVALVGSIGAGKSTLADLLLKFYDPIDGQILIDNLNIEKYNLSSLRSKIAIIKQETFILNNSLFYNLTYGINKISEQDLISTLKQAKAEELLTILPPDLETEIGDRGVSLSAAQIQAIAIIRAILRNPELLVIDEISNSFDTITEKIIITSLIELSRDRTTLIITNRLPLLRTANQIVVLNQGKIMEVGTHQQLLQKGDFYHRFYSTQFKSTPKSLQPQLANKIAKKLAQQNNSNLSTDIRNHLDSLLSYLYIFNEGLFANDPEEDKILDESYLAAKKILDSLKEYERKIEQELNDSDQ
ncbi:ABC transporter ATP-binding protein [Chondrocystis sp. NIES-4102]|nr:ABC transporter ATP-binding protein [Chondrocystis sp. NIES-4102]